MKKLNILLLLILLTISNSVSAQSKANKPSQKELFDTFFSLSSGDSADRKKQMDMGMGIMKMDSTSKYTFYILAWANMLKKNYPTALYWSKNKLVDKYPDFAEGHFIYGQILQLEGKEGGLDEIQKCMELNPKLTVPCYYLATNYYEMKNYKLSLLYYNKLEKIDVNHKSLYYNRACVKSVLEDYNGAIEDYVRVILKNPKHIRALYNRSTLYLKIEEYEKAQVDLTNVISQNPSYDMAYYYRGYCYYNLSKLTEACADLKIAVDLGNADASNLQSQICK